MDSGPCSDRSQPSSSNSRAPPVVKRLVVMWTQDPVLTTPNHLFQMVLCHLWSKVLSWQCVDVSPPNLVGGLRTLFWQLWNTYFIALAPPLVKNHILEMLWCIVAKLYMLTSVPVLTTLNDLLLSHHLWSKVISQQCVDITKLAWYVPWCLAHQRLLEDLGCHYLVVWKKITMVNETNEMVQWVKNFFIYFFDGKGRYRSSG